MDGQTGGHTEFLSILQDFVPSQGCCRATLCNFKTAKKQGKGTADHLMPLGDWFIHCGISPSIVTFLSYYSIATDSFAALTPFWGFGLGLGQSPADSGEILPVHLSIHTPVHPYVQCPSTALGHRPL